MINIRRITTTVAAAGAIAATVALTSAAPAFAGYSAVESCTGLSGSITYSPGLTSTVKTQQAIFTGTLSGCSGYNGVQQGTGTVTAVLTGSSKVGAVVESGNATVSWPASSGLNPSNANLTIRESAAGGIILVQGSVTSGAFTGSVLSTSLQPYANTGSGTKSHPLRQQLVVNTLPFAARVNFG
ncbi:MAG: hypothetical protein JWN06_1737 [Propionibacteriaceae bacterium]|jgi:hypothetical protein|nr:hypothetical protein [Propionibacteriaceae bacterium]